MAKSDAVTMTGGAEGDSGPGASPSGPLHGGSLVARRYRLVERLGAGAMGEVWRARHEELHTDLAIKFALAEEDDEGAIERFRFEAQVSAQLGQKTPHIVAVHDAGRHDGVPFLAMEYVAGQSLEAILDSRGALDEEDVAAILDDVASALTVAHAQGIWHRDIKPANIMVTTGDDGRPRAKLADFGVAKALGNELALETPATTVQGALIGTPSYMSPEQIENAVEAIGAPSDVWSLAVVAYEAVTGSVAFDSATMSRLLVEICSRPHVPPSRVAPRLAKFDALFERALAKDPADRIGSATELADAFRAAMAAPAKQLSSRRRTVALALGALAVASAVAMFVASEDPEVAADATSEIADMPEPPSPATTSVAATPDEPDSSPTPDPSAPPARTEQTQPATAQPATAQPAKAPPAPAPTTPPPKPAKPTPAKPKPRVFDESEKL